MTRLALQLLRRRGFAAAAGGIQAQLKAFQQTLGGGRSLAKLSPWFESFAGPAGAPVQGAACFRLAMAKLL